MSMVHVDPVAARRWETAPVTVVTPVAVLVLLGLLRGRPGLGTAGVLTGLACGIGLAVAVHVGLARTPGRQLGPADRVTLTRAVISCGIAALVTDGVANGADNAAIVTATAALALLLDLADGWVARRTGTTSAFGARFDGEADAFLIAVLSVAAAQVWGAWVLVLGGVRYGFLVAGWCIPALSASLPPRYWRKVVTAVVGIALVAGVSGVLPRPVALSGLVASAALLAESFGRDVVWLWRRRSVLADAEG